MKVSEAPIQQPTTTKDNDNMNGIINNWHPETKSLIKALLKAGCHVIAGHNGEDKFVPCKDGTEKVFLDELLACDECWLTVSTPTSTGEKSLYLILGNDPGELVCDYNKDDTLDQVIESEANKWTGKKQPTTTRK